MDTPMKNLPEAGTTDKKIEEICVRRGLEITPELMDYLERVALGREKEMKACRFKRKTKEGLDEGTEFQLVDVEHSVRVNAARLLKEMTLDKAVADVKAMPEKKKKPEEAMRKQDVLEKAIEQIQKERAAKKLKASPERVPEDI